MLPRDTARIRFRQMTSDDIDEFAALLGDAEVMRFYSSVKSRDEAAAWIRGNQRNYAQHGYGLWVIETKDGEFVGDCGLTWQPVGTRTMWPRSASQPRSGWCAGPTMSAPMDRPTRCSTCTFAPVTIPG